jgi:Flp pilus assembly protein TadB
VIQILGVILAVLLGSSFVALGVFGVLGLTASVATVLSARRERRLADELDRALDEIVGPRSRSSV